ncbi:MAG: Endonuclease/Exonuclease/phosphatase family protein [Candidatus Accumulibacter cognatus]|uniref:Endonuclease/Exonuclease/phosphatase family protein n=2 Tax=Candidatus Accumulibacter cognatus TaxID=2954383 RepID=A0A080M6G7_9PROT|nr:MAG: Endonuclease/Exonuclease/phosphatase family protein [Candidatus Accumulibacter cognatus]
MDECQSDLDERKAEITLHCEDAGIDVALLQEIKTVYAKGDQVWHECERPWRMSKIYGDNSYFIYADQRGPSKNGEGIASRWQLRQVDFGPLPMGLFGRAYVMATIELQGLPLRLLTFHLEPPAIGRMITQYRATTSSQDAVRRTQLQYLARLIESRNDDVPLVVGGDFNIDGMTPELQAWARNLGLRAVFADGAGHGSSRKTFATHRSPSFDCGREMRLDHLFVRGSRSFDMTVETEGMFLASPVAAENRYFYGYLSDHVGLFADLKITAR